MTDNDPGDGLPKTGPGDAQRKLAAIMFVDMVGYTSLGQRNESLSLALVEEQRRLVRPIIERHLGREVKTMGDAFLVEFASALDAVRCAYDVQREAREFNVSQPEDRRVHLRVGVHLGDVVEKEGDIFGDAVNVASRIEPLAEDGGICITQQVYDHVRNKFELPLTSLGKKELKNVQVPVEVYAVALPWSGPASAPVAARDRRRVAVLPFTNISSDPKDEYFSDGLTEELIAHLSSLAGLRVIARTSVMRFKGSSKGVAEISGELNAGSILEGSVRKAGRKLRVTAQLIDPTSEEHLWTQSYDKDMEDVFAIQTDISQKVAEALKVRLLSTEIEGMGGRATQSVEAYNLYLKGMHHLNKRSEAGLLAAVSYFEQAIRLDPEYTLAYAGLGDSYSLMGFYGYRPPPDVYPKARELIQKALALNGSMAEAHASLGEVLMHHYWDWPGAGSSLRRSLSLKGNYATAHMWLATWLMAQGRLLEAQSEERKALELDPLSLIINCDYARSFYFLRRFDEAGEQYRKAIELDPSFAIAHKGLADVLTMAGRYREALAEIQTAIEASEGSFFIKDDLGYVYSLSGEQEKARGTLEELKAASNGRYVPPYGIAVIHFGLGEDGEGFRWLERCYQEHSFMTFIKVDPIFDRLHGDPRFASLLSRMGLAGQVSK